MRKIIEKLNIAEISAVTIPASKHAKVAIVKSGADVKSAALKAANAETQARDKERERRARVSALVSEEMQKGASHTEALRMVKQAEPALFAA